MATKTTTSRRDNTFVFVLSDFNLGQAPLAHLDSLTTKGNAGHYSVAQNVNVLNGVLSQGPGLADLTGTLDELINYILEIPVADGVTYGIGATKLFKIKPGEIDSTGGFPHPITNCVDGSSVAYLKNVLYYFYNTATQGIIGAYNLTDTFDDDWQTSLEKAPHPVATKEDLMLFGNGRYVGAYVNETDIMDIHKLDFGNGFEVADIVFHGNYWYIAVNGGVSGTNRSVGQVYLYDGAATEGILADETGVGFQKIGFLYVLNGVVYVAYQDLSSTGGYKIGYILGRQIKPLASFTGGLPTFAQKTLYQNNILFNAGGNLWAFGSVSPELPLQISQIADGGYAAVGALASPFGTPMVASTETVNGETRFRLAKFSGYDKNSFWKSIVIPTSSGIYKGYIDNITVMTNALGSGAGATLTIEADQATRTSNSKTITTAGKTRHIFNTFGLKTINDLRICINYGSGSTVNPCQIRSIVCRGHWVESA